MLTLRLARTGTRKKPVYHLVATDSRNARDGRFCEKLGYYIPNRVLNIKNDRIQYWIDQGAALSSTAKRLIRQSKKTAEA